MHSFKGPNFEIKYQQLGDSQSPVKMIWAHGWGMDHKAFMPLAESLKNLGHHILIDAPGFGSSPVPFDRIENSWSSKDYANACALLIKDIAQGQPVIWIGHSFGCRIATQLGAHYPQLIKAMIYVAGAGLKRKRSPLQSLIIKSKIALYKTGKHLRKIPAINAWANHKKFGSADYQNAGPMRGTLVKVVNEHLSAEAAKITCPVLLIYGDKDTETPPQIGQDYKAVIKNAKLLHLKDQDHYTVLHEGAPQILKPIKSFILQESE